MGGALGEKGLSVGVHIWEPLAHSCPLSACLRMDLDGTGREGLGGRFAPVDGNPDESERQRGLEGGKGPGKRGPSTLPQSQSRTSGPRSRRPACPTFAFAGLGGVGHVKLEGGNQIPRPSTPLGSQGHGGQNPVSAPDLQFLVCKAGGLSGRWLGGLGQPGQAESLFLAGVEAWECDTSPSSGKSCGGTCGHFSDGARGAGGGGVLFLCDCSFIPQ